MKILKFAEPLPKLILDGLKNTTWRITDYKISVGDQISLCYNDGREFAKATAIGVKQTTFRNLTAEDKEGHEKYQSDEEMYQTFSKYYDTKVTPETRLFVIKFKLL